MVWYAMSVGVGRIFESVCLSVSSITQKRIIPKCSNLVWLPQKLYCFGVQRSKVKVTFVRWWYQYYNVTTALHYHSLLARWRHWQEQYGVGSHTSWLIVWLKPGFHSNAIACVAFEWKPGFSSQWAMMTCVTVATPCKKNPCHHNLPCTSNNAGTDYSCDCGQKYTRKDCETGK